jgi:hypothetical protein
MKLLYYLAAIGPDQYEKKIELFFKNIDHIFRHMKDEMSTIDVMINMYEDNPGFIDSIHTCKRIDNVYIHKRKGVLAELWKTNPHHTVVKNYDMVFFILDDIELEDLHINKMLEVKEKHKLDIISPRVRKATHKWLMDSFKKDEYLLLVNMVEIYTMLITPDVFYRFMEVQDVENKWIWGVDMMLGHFGFKCGIYNDACVLHYFPNKTNNREASNSMMRYVKKHGYDNTKQIKRKYPEIKSRLKRDK